MSYSSMTLRQRIGLPQKVAFGISKYWDMCVVINVATNWSSLTDCGGATHINTVAFSAGVAATKYRAVKPVTCMCA